ncbi:MAG: sensor histidine kinase [Nitrospiraceae bacterium]
MLDPQPARVVILGGGKGGTALLDLLSHIPGIEIIGVADKDPSAPGFRRALDLNLKVTHDVVDLIADESVNLIVDVTGDPDVQAVIRARKPTGAEVLGGAASRLLWNLVQHEAQMQAQLFTTEKLASIGTFASGIAHDINNPLYMIQGLAENIEQESDLSATREHARDIVRAVQRVSALSKDLTQYARQSATYDLVEVELNPKLDEAFRIARHATVLQDLSVVKEYTSKTAIKAKPEEILHVFVNLITNAIQAMEGKGTLTLGSECQDGVVRVKISDSGCGIPKENLGKIFDPFFTTKPPDRGTGLGLHNVRAIVHKYQGLIHVDSEVGKGTTFRLQFQGAAQT